jgi:hypothetical protein
MNQTDKVAIGCAVGHQRVWQAAQAKADQAQAAADAALARFRKSIANAANAHPEECGQGWLQHHIINTLMLKPEDLARLKKLGLHQFEMKCKVSNTVTLIVAKNSTDAWGKFCEQHFGALKPAPSQYIVTKLA